MAPHSSRPSISAQYLRRGRPVKSVRLRCEQFEDKIVPALFNAQPPIVITGLTNAGCVASADFNKDGIMDAVLTNFGTGHGSPHDTGTPGTNITFLRGSATGFMRLTVDAGGTNPSFVEVGDLNGDGWTDAVVTNQNRQVSGSYTVFKNNGAGDLSAIGTFQTGTINPDCVRIADMTGDGVPDIIVSSFGANTQTLGGSNVTIYQQGAEGGKGNFSFSSSPITTLAPAIQFIPQAIAVDDFNGDGIMDIAAVNPGVPPDVGQLPPNGDVYIFRGTGSGGFAASFQIESGGVHPVNIQAADVNGDGKKDLIIANTGDASILTPTPSGAPLWDKNSVGVVLNTSTPSSVSFGFTNSIPANCNGTFAVQVADFNMDGKADIAAVNYGNLFGAPNAFVAAYMGNGLGSFSTAAPGGIFDTLNQSPGGQYLAVGDYNGDNKLDLIVAHADSRVGLLYNGTAASQPSVSSVGVDNGTGQRSMVRSLTVTFSAQVTFTGQPSAAFQLRQNGSSIDIPVTVDLTGSTATQTIAKLTFSPGTFTEGSATNPTLKDGNYTLTVLSSQITGGLATGNNPTSLYRLFGDINGDRAVTGLDLAAFRTAFGSSTGNPNYVDALDFNGDGVINGLDLPEFRNRFGTSLAP